MSHLLEVEGFLVDRNPVHKFHKFLRNAECFSIFSAYPVRVYPELSPECHSRHSQWHCHLGDWEQGLESNIAT